MAHSSYSPYPSVDSASDYSPEPAATTAPTKRRARGSMTAEERREARAHRNRLAAQSSRDRKKVQFEHLTVRVNQLEEENRSLRLGLVQHQPSSSSSSVDAALAKENKELRERIQQLEQAWQNMTKILGSMSIPLPQQQQLQQQPRSLSSSHPSMPLSPATTASPKSEPIEFVAAASESSTCELARRDVPAAGGPLGALFNHQALVGTEQVAASPVFDINNTSTASSVINGHWDEHSLLLTNPVTTPLDDGYGEMDRLLELLPSPSLDQGLDIGLSSVINNTDDWNWLNEGNF